MTALALERGALAGAARSACSVTHEIANRIRRDVDSEVCNSDSWVNGVPPMVEMTLEEAEEISKSLRRVADLLERIGGAV